MPRVELPAGEFIIHAAGQHNGTIYGVDIRYNETSRFGTSNRIVLKIISDTPMQNATGEAMFNDDGSPRHYGQWDWLNISRSGRLKDRREAIMGRAMTKEEMDAEDFDPVEEFIGKRIGYVIKQGVGKNTGKPYASLESVWPLNGEQAEIPAHAAELIANTENKTYDNGEEQETLNYMGPSSQQTIEDDGKVMLTPEQVTDITAKEKATGFADDRIVAARKNYLEIGDLFAESVDPAKVNIYVQELEKLATNDLPF